MAPKNTKTVVNGKQTLDGATAGKEGAEQPGIDKITTVAELKSYLSAVRDRMEDGTGASIYAMSAVNYVFSLEKIYDLLDSENRTTLKEIWLRLKQSGVQVRNPPLLFEGDR